MKQVYKNITQKDDFIILTMEFQCDICFKTFSRQSDLNRHKKSIHNKSESFACDKCEKKFNRKDKLDEHFRKCSIICKYCDSNFEHQRDLNDHELLLHTNRKYMCTNCTKTYSVKRDLKKHREKCKQMVSLIFESFTVMIFILSDSCKRFKKDAYS